MADKVKLLEVTESEYRLIVEVLDNYLSTLDRISTSLTVVRREKDVTRKLYTKLSDPGADKFIEDWAKRK